MIGDFGAFGRANRPENCSSSPRRYSRAMGAERVLVTGGSGFIGAHCILQLLAAGHRVRTTVRSLAREPMCARC